MRLQDVKQVLVVGTGMMGPGIAVLFARAGFKTNLWGPTPEGRLRGMANCCRNLQDLLKERLISSAEYHEVLGRLTVFDDLQPAGQGIDFVVEAVLEILDLKQDLFARLEEVCPARAVLASNTSTLYPSAINRKMGARDRMLVAHFWNPAHLVPLVEICGSAETSPEVVELTMQVMKKIGKEPVLIKKEVPGFIGNRLMHAMNREAISLVAQGIAEPADIEKVVLNSFGPRFANLGPLEYLDFVGIDHVTRIQGYLYGDLDNTPGEQPLVLEMVKKGALGAKAGRGFFDWTGRDIDAVRLRRDKEFIRRMKEEKK